MTSKVVAEDINNAFRDPVTLKKRIENLTGISDLPFVTIDSSIEYLQDLVDSLESKSIDKLYTTGRYEYVYIAYTKGREKRTLNRDAIDNACANDYVDTINFMLANSKLIRSSDVHLIMRTSILKKSNKIVARLLEDVTRENVLENRDRPDGDLIYI
jgi:hypothetical protein